MSAVVLVPQPDIVMFVIIPDGCKVSRGQVWNECGSPCTPSCDNPNPKCPPQCVPRCECKPSKPLRKGKKCVKPKSCP